VRASLCSFARARRHVLCTSSRPKHAEHTTCLQVVQVCRALVTRGAAPLDPTRFLHMLHRTTGICRGGLIVL
jgi:hypothetical protein